MARRSAGLLMFRHSAGGLQVLLVHPGGPAWTSADLGAWSIPKGEYDESEDALAAAVREFKEETGWTATAPFLPLGSIRQHGGKLVSAWAFEGDADPATLVSNTFEIVDMVNGAVGRFPEVDRAAWFEPAEARRRVMTSQAAFIDELERVVQR